MQDSSSSTPSISSFLDTFAPPVRQQDPYISLQHWLDVMQNPSTHYPDASEYEIKARIQAAKRNARKLLQKHPDLLPRCQSDAQQGVNRG